MFKDQTKQPVQKRSHRKKKPVNHNKKTERGSTSNPLNPPKTNLVVPAEAKHLIVAGRDVQQGGHLPRRAEQGDGPGGVVGDEGARRRLPAADGLGHTEEHHRRQRRGVVGELAEDLGRGRERGVDEQHYGLPGGGSVGLALPRQGAEVRHFLVGVGRDLDEEHRGRFQRRGVLGEGAEGRVDAPVYGGVALVRGEE